MRLPFATPVAGGSRQLWYSEACCPPALADAGASCCCDYCCIFFELFEDFRMACDTFFDLLGQGRCTVQSFTDRCRYFERVSHRSLIRMGSLAGASRAAMELEMRIGLLLGHPRVMIEMKPMVVARVDIWNAIFWMVKHVLGLDPSSCVHLLLLLQLIVLMSSLVRRWLLRGNVNRIIEIFYLLIDQSLTMIGIGLNEVAIDDIKLLLVTV